MASAHKEKVSKNNFIKKKQTKDTISGYLFLTPAFLCYGIFTVVPIVLAFIYSFTDKSLFGDVNFIGWENYTDLISDSGKITSFVNTFKFLLILCPMHVILGLILAFLVYRANHFQFFLRSAIYFPSIVTTASVAIAWGYLFSTDLGVVNYYVKLMGFDAIRWLTDASVVYITIALFSFWKFIGTTFLYYFIGMQNIPVGLYEAARIDGSGTIHTFFHITIPLLTPTIFFVLITNVIAVFQIFDEPYFLTNGGPGTATKTVALEIYQTAFKQMNISYGSALSVLLFLIIMTITVIQFTGQRKWVVYDYE